VPGERIDVVWGDNQYGLAHIITKHPEVVDRLPQLLAGMREVKSPVEGRMRFEGGGYVAVVSREWTGQEKTWLLTAFELRGKGGSGPDSPSGLRPAADVQPSLSRYYGEEAGPNGNVGGIAGDGNREIAAIHTQLFAEIDRRITSDREIAEELARGAGLVTGNGDRFSKAQLSSIVRTMVDRNVPIADAFHAAVSRVYAGTDNVGRAVGNFLDSVQSILKTTGLRRLDGIEHTGAPALSRIALPSRTDVDAAWRDLAQRHPEFDEPAIADASKAAEAQPSPASISPEPSARVAAAEKQLAEAEAFYKANEEYVPQEIRDKLDHELAKLDVEASDRAEVIQRGAACLAAAMGAIA
jgi:hypothetical protein